MSLGLVAHSNNDYRRALRFYEQALERFARMPATAASQPDLLREAPAPPEATLARLNRLSDTSRRAARQMADVVWSLHTSSAQLPEVLVHMRDHARLRSRRGC